jgi:hypothetical protein
MPTLWWLWRVDVLPTLLAFGGTDAKGEINDIIPALQTAVDEHRGLTAKETKQILTTLLKENES